MRVASTGSGILGSSRGQTRSDTDPVAVGILLVGFASLALPLFWDWSRGTFASGTQGHEIAIVAVSVWLGFRKRAEIEALIPRPATWAGSLLFMVGLALYYLGRAYDVRVALLSLVLLAAGVMAYFIGFRALRAVWFALFFPLFAAPLPLDWVLTLTGPMKVAVSAVAADLLRTAGYDAARAGVVITIGQYQLLVTEACAGLQTMFVLEAMSLLYTNLMGHKSVLRNLLLVVCAIPVAFVANVVRVVVLALVTLHFGDAAGQGFLHGFAGLTLFAVALVLIIGLDWLLGRSIFRGGNT